jgi:hypothetical protein
MPVAVCENCPGDTIPRHPAKSIAAAIKSDARLNTYEAVTFLLFSPTDSTVERFPFQFLSFLPPWVELGLTP